jgi:hypothetical protein
LISDVTTVQQMADILFNDSDISNNTVIETLTLATLDIDQLNSYLSTYAQQLVLAGSDEASVVDDAYEMSSLLLEVLQLIQTSYQLAQQQQYYQMEYDTYNAQYLQLQEQMKEENNDAQWQQLAVVLLDSKIFYLQTLVMKYLTEEYRQYNYWAAANLTMSMPLNSTSSTTSTCEIPSVIDMETSQCKI